MDRSRTATAAAGLVYSLVVSGALWWYFESFVFFLLVPFVPFLFRTDDARARPPVRECPRCGYRTTNEAFEYCPRDGTRLD